MKCKGEAVERHNDVFVNINPNRVTNDTKMMISTLRERKVDAENQHLNSDWTEKYVFLRKKQISSLGTEFNTFTKEYNLQKQFKTMHPKFDAIYRLGSDKMCTMLL